MTQDSLDAVEKFLLSAQKEFREFAVQLSGEVYEKAVDMIMEARSAGNRLHITGVGKPSHAAQYAAALFSSTGTPCYYLNATEAVHGSCGQLVRGDIVVCISNSGETEELKTTVRAIRNNGCRLIAVTGKEESWLGRFCDVCLYAGVRAEGDAMNRAPRNSILAELLTLQALSTALQTENGWTKEDYVRCHPSGKLGVL